MKPHSLSRAVRQAADPNAVPAALAGRYPVNQPVNGRYQPRSGRLWSTR